MLTVTRSGPHVHAPRRSAVRWLRPSVPPEMEEMTSSQAEVHHIKPSILLVTILRHRLSVSGNLREIPHLTFHHRLVDDINVFDKRHRWGCFGLNTLRHWFVITWVWCVTDINQLATTLFFYFFVIFICCLYFSSQTLTVLIWYFPCFIHLFFLLI